MPRLDEILARVRDEAQARERSGRPLPPRRDPVRSLRGALAERPLAVIAEIKRASPSAGPLRPGLAPALLAARFEAAGARAVSVLTCGPFFRGALADLGAARGATTLPLLCKDFLVTPFQVREAFHAGADAVLLIAAALEDEGLHELTELARSLGLEVLHEVHAPAELDRVLGLEPTLLGVNSRDLRTMQVDPEPALALGPSLPKSVLGVFESGIRSARDLQRAHAHGYRAVLVGEALMRAADPGAALAELCAWEPAP